MTSIDTDWFTTQLSNRKLSQRGLAKFMGIDPASVHRLLTGKRPMRFDEAGQLATLLGVTVDDVLRHAGMPVGAGQMIPVVGSVDGAGLADLDWGRELYRVPSPGEMPANTVAAVMHTAATPWDPLDGWTLFFSPPVDGVPAEAIGRMCLVRTAGNGPIMLRFLRRGYVPGRWNLMAFGAASIEDVALDWAVPVQHIRT